MSVRLGGIIKQLGDDDIYRLVKGKDVDLTQADLMGDALDDNDLILIDDGASGTQDSTKKSVVSRIWDYIVSKLGSATSLTVGNYVFDADQTVGAGQDGYVLTFTNGAGISLQDASGLDGQAGPPGDDGLAATISVGTVSTGAAGSSATVTNVGSSSAAVFDFSIPKGDDGDPATNTDTKISNVRDNDTLTNITDVSSIRFTGELCSATGTTGIATVSVGGTIDRLSDVDETISPSSGDVLIYNSTSSKYEPQDLTAGSNITITNGDGSITIAADQRTQEEIEDFVNGLIVGGDHITVTYNDTAGTLTINKDTTTSYYPSISGLDTDGEASGEIVYIGQSGDNLTAGSVYYYTSSGSWQAADADAVSTASGLIGMALGTNPTTAGVLLRGYGVSSSNLGTVGSVVYLSTTAGEVTETAPSGNGDVVRVMGYTLNATSDLMYFNPSPDWIELTV